MLLYQQQQAVVVVVAILCTAIVQIGCGLCTAVTVAGSNVAAHWCGPCCDRFVTNLFPLDKAGVQLQAQETVYTCTTCTPITKAW